jgi:hypothetical protein
MEVFDSSYEVGGSLDIAGSFGFVYSVGNAGFVDLEVGARS